MKKRVFFAPGVCVILYLIIALAANYVPLIGMVCPVLLMLTGAFSLLKNSKISLGIGCIICTLATFFACRLPVYSIVYTLGYIAAGFFLCYSVLKGKSGANTLIVTLIFVLIADYGSVIFNDMASGKAAFAFVDEMFANLKPLLMEAIKQSAQVLKIDDPELVFSLYEMSVKMMLPAIITIIILIKTIILCWIVKIIINKVIGIVIIDMRFSMFRADGVTVLVFFISTLVSLFAGDSVIAVVFSNLYVILTVVLLLCGMSLLDWYLRDVQKIKTFFRFLILAVLSIFMFFPVLPVLFTVAALIDARRNFRQIGVNTDDNQN